MAATIFANVSPSVTNSVLIPAVPNRSIRVFGLAANCGSSATPVYFNSFNGSNATEISMPISLGPYGAFILPQPAYELAQTAWFQTNIGEALTATTGSGSNIGIQIVYDIFSGGSIASVVVLNPFSVFSVFNVTSTFTLDANNYSLDTLANVLGTLIQLFQSGTTNTSSFTTANITPTFSYDTTTDTMDQLANFLGTLINALTPTGTSPDTFTVSNVTPTYSFNATSTSIDQVANVLGTVVATLIGAGYIQ